MAKLSEVRLKAGWLIDDVRRAQSRLGEWSKIGELRSNSLVNRRETELTERTAVSESALAEHHEFD